MKSFPRYLLAPLVPLQGLLRSQLQSANEESESKKGWAAL